jgi:hypothetical protein
MNALLRVSVNSLGRGCSGLEQPVASTTAFGEKFPGADALSG